MAAEHEQPQRPGVSGGASPESAGEPVPMMQPGAPQPQPAPPQRVQKPKMSWSRRFEKLVLSIFCLEVGGFLLVFPWMTYWNDNFFFTFAEQLRPFFLSPYFKGAISGLGALNLYLAIVESVDFLGSFLD